MTDDPVQSPNFIGRICRCTFHCAMHVGMLLTVVVLLCVVIPWFVTYFEQTEMPLPVTTQQIVELSDLLVDFWYLLLPLAIGGDAAIVLVFGVALARRHWLLSMYSHALHLAFFLYLAWMITGLGAPLYAAAQVVSSSVE